METCQYEQVNTSISMGRPFIRQMLVCSSVWMSYFTVGLCNGAPTVIIPQLRREANSTAAVSDDMASWMSSIQNYAAIPWIIVLPIVTECCGRKLPFLFKNFCTFCSFIVFYFSSSVTHILLGEVIQGTINGGNMCVTIMIIAEYSSPRYRGIFQTIGSASFAWGLWCSNALGTFYAWKTISILGVVCSAYCVTNSIFWLESPIWLASKGHFGKCAGSHRWLNGIEDNSEKELEKLLESQQKFQREFENQSIHRRAKDIVLSVQFYKPLCICLAAKSLFILSGKFVCVVYAIDILRKITGNESTAYTGMLILDGVTVLGMYIGCILSKFVKRRTLLLSGSFMGILFLYIISFYLYLIKLSIIVDNNYVCIFLLSIFSIGISSGPMLLCPTIFGESIPLRFRSFSVFVISFYSTCLCGTMIKIFPYLFKIIQLHGVFLFYGVTSTVCTLFLYKYLPETKDMTLLEIEDCLKTGSL